MTGRRASQALDGSRAGGLHSRTIEVLDQRGIADRFLAEGNAIQVQGFAGIPLDMPITREREGLRPEATRAPRRADHLVRIACCGAQNGSRSGEGTATMAACRSRISKGSTPGGRT